MDTKTFRPIALIIGASQGLGRSVAQGLADGDHDLVIVDDDHAAVEAMAAQLRGSRRAPWVRAVTADLTEPQAVARILDALGIRRLEVDVFVCSARIVAHDPGAWGSARESEPARQLNVCAAVIELTRRVAVGMVERGQGRILFAASVAGQPTPLLGAYGAMKAFVFSFAETIRDELHQTGVSVTAPHPGTVRMDIGELLPRPAAVHAA